MGNRLYSTKECAEIRRKVLSEQQKMKRPVPVSIRKGDLVKRKAEGGHVMTVIEISNDAKAIIGSYTTPDGVRHDEHWKVADLKRIAI